MVASVPKLVYLEIWRDDVLHIVHNRVIVWAGAPAIVLQISSHALTRSVRRGCTMAGRQRCDTEDGRLRSSPRCLWDQSNGKKVYLTVR